MESNKAELIEMLSEMLETAKGLPEKTTWTGRVENGIRECEPRDGWRHFEPDGVTTLTIRIDRHI